VNLIIPCDVSYIPNFLVISPLLCFLQLKFETSSIFQKDSLFIKDFGWFSIFSLFAVQPCFSVLLHIKFFHFTFEVGGVLVHPPPCYDALQ
jgi:hypothetical protein